MTQESNPELSIGPSDLTQRWPIELWLSVFDLAYPIQLWDPRLGLRNLLSLSWVCTRWRQAAIAHKPFWSIIVLDWPYELLELYLQRSVDHPLHIFFNSDHGDPDFVDEERHTIQRNFRHVFGDAFNMGRIRRMDLTVLDTSLNIVLDEYISQHEAHSLERLIYNTENYGLRRRPAFARAFGGVPPPRLRSLALSGDKIPAQSPVLSTSITDLTLDAIDLGDINCIFGVLKSLFSLERLKLWNSLDDLRDGDIRLDKMVVLAKLQRLEVGDETLAVVNFIRQLRLPCLQDLQLSIMHESLAMSLPLVQSSMVVTFTAVEDMLVHEMGDTQISYDELHVRFGVTYSHLEFDLSGGRDGLPQRLRFSFHDTDYLDDESQLGEDDARSNMGLIRYGLRKLPFLSRIQTLIIGPIVYFAQAIDWLEAIQDIPHIQAVACIGVFGVSVMLGLVHALRVRPMLFKELTRVRFISLASSISIFERELGDHLAQLRLRGDLEVKRGTPLELCVEGPCGSQSDVIECLRMTMGATSVRVIET